MEPDAGTTAWMLTASALVLFMTPGLAFFYGGLSRAKSVLNMLMMSFSAMAVVTVLWALYGYSMTFGSDLGGLGLLGNPLDFLGMSGTVNTVGSNADGLPDLVFSAFQLMFAIITVALISGAIADRVKFGSWIVFIGLWATLVYFPVAHWVFALDDGWIAAKLGALDFAGGTAVHINSGVAALALALVVGKRHGWPGERMRPHSVPLVLLGAGILWFGWFGFNAGSATAADNIAGLSFFNTQLATAAAVIAWIGVEKLRDGHATTVGAASGAVAGLVGITPACASVNPMGALLLGLVVGGACSFAVGFKHKLGYDDSLDVVGVHLVGGLVGTLLVGLLAASEATGDGTAGLLWGGGASQLVKQAVAAGAVLAYSFVVTLVLALIIKVTIGWRIDEQDEVEGIDASLHAETAYEMNSLGGGGSSSTFAQVTNRARKVEA